MPGFISIQIVLRPHGVQSGGGPPQSKTLARNCEKQGFLKDFGVPE
jgi:hypothetical protein